MTAPAAVLWDMDGTLTDTEPLWLDAELRLAQQYGARWAHEDALAVVGTPLLNTARLLRERGVRLPPDRIVRIMAQEVADRIDKAAAAGAAPWHRGAIELAGDIAAAGIPQALVTSSPTEVAAAVARAAGVFDVVVSGDDVERAKPDPAPYRQAAAALGIEPCDAVVLEDSPSGIAAGRAVGARVIAVETALPVRREPGLRVVGSLAELRLADLGLPS
ncbi:HAD family hydrolase [Microbacterium sp.]|uniref:HAD family hydrolase n=1 Tax=Microbacterium sp. TaxID=51671 RepID=UPI003C74BCDF